MYNILRFERCDVLGPDGGYKYQRSDDTNYYICFYPREKEFYGLRSPYGQTVNLTDELIPPCPDYTTKNIFREKILIVNNNQILPECLNLMASVYDQEERRLYFYTFYEQFNDYKYRLRPVEQRTKNLEYMKTENYPKRIIDTYKIKLEELEDEHAEYMRKYNEKIKTLKNIYRQKIYESFESLRDCNSHSIQYYYNIIGHIPDDNNDEYDSE